VIIGLVPDLVVRPQLASRQAKLPVSLYFVGFVGGVLTVGVIGVVAGPLVVALLIETVQLLAGDEAVPAG
jgi:predicted PurR-regulated permease PerM